MSVKTKKTSFVSEKTTRERQIVSHLTEGQVICVGVPDSKTGEDKMRVGNVEAIGETPDKMGEIRVWVKLAMSDNQFRTFYVDRMSTHIYDENGLVARVV